MPDFSPWSYDFHNVDDFLCLLYCIRHLIYFLILYFHYKSSTMIPRDKVDTKKLFDLDSDVSDEDSV